MCRLLGARDKLLAQITLSEVAGHEARDFGWLVRALQLLRAARQVRAYHSMGWW
jgi:hypothetical protein